MYLHSCIYRWLLLGFATKIASSPVPQLEIDINLGGSVSNSDQFTSHDAETCETQSSLLDCNSDVLGDLITINSESSLNVEMQQSISQTKTTATESDGMPEPRSVPNSQLEDKDNIPSIEPSPADGTVHNLPSAPAPLDSSYPATPVLAENPVMKEEEPAPETPPPPAPVTPPPAENPKTPSPPAAPPSFETLCLDIHNGYREKHVDTQFLIWDNTLAQVAYEHASKCVYKHQDPEHNPYAENIAFGQDTINKASFEWYSEVRLFDFNAQVLDERAGHFINMCHIKMERFGCVSHYCAHATFADGTTQAGLFHVCEYSGGYANDFPLVNPLVNPSIDPLA